VDRTVSEDTVRRAKARATRIEAMRHDLCSALVSMQRAAGGHQAVDAPLLGALGLAAGGLAVVAPWEVAVAGFLVLALVVRGWRPRVVATAIVVAAVGIGRLRAQASVDRHEKALAEADTVIPLPARCAGHARVDSSPVRVRGAARWDATIEASCDGAGSSWRGRATVYGGPEELARGDEVDVVATLAPPQRLWNTAAGDPRPGEALRGVVRTGGALDVRLARRASGLIAWIDRQRARVRHRIDATFDARVGPMARALVLGESDLAPDDDDAFRGSGLSHLLAVSGMHLVLVLALAMRVLEGTLRRIEALAAVGDVGRYAAAVGIPIAWVYAEFAGAGGSTLRAAWMATAALAARALGRRGDATRAFGLSVGAMAMAEPLVGLRHVLRSLCGRDRRAPRLRAAAR